MAQQSFGAFGPIKVRDLSGASEREIETERQGEVLRDSKCTFLLQFHQEKRMREQTTTEVKEKDNMAFPCLHK